MKFTQQEMETIHNNLKIGKCPNCGSEEPKIIDENSIELISFLREEAGHEMDEQELEAYEAILAQCPHCGYLMLFSKEFIMDK